MWPRGRRSFRVLCATSHTRAPAASGNPPVSSSAASGFQSVDAVLSSRRVPQTDFKLEQVPTPSAETARNHSSGTPNAGRWRSTRTSKSSHGTDVRRPRLRRNRRAPVTSGARILRRFPPVAGYAGGVAVRPATSPVARCQDVGDRHPPSSAPGDRSRWRVTSREPAALWLSPRPDARPQRVAGATDRFRRGRASRGRHVRTRYEPDHVRNG